MDTLVLGCTHYPLLREVIAQTMGPQVTLVDVGAVCAAQTVQNLGEAGLLREGGEGGFRCYVSDTTEDFARLAAIFVGEVGPIPVERVEIAGGHALQ